MTDPPYVSVIIPVYNQPDLLQRCLDALSRQTVPGDQFEVVVVDNGSDESVEHIVSRYANARLLYEDRRGSYAARNAGISQARGDVIAFTDADCVTKPDWLERGRDRLSSEANCGLLAGEIDVVFQDPDKPTTAEVYSALGQFNQRRNVMRDRFGPTANLFTSRAVLDDVGMFNPDYQSGGDREWSHRVLGRGYRQVFDPTVRVDHPAERSFRLICSRRKRYVGGYVTHLKAGGGYSFGQLLADLFRDVRPPLRLYPKLVRSPNGGGIRRLPSYIFLTTCVGFSKACERMRVFAGGSPRRA